MKRMFGFVSLFSKKVIGTASARSDNLRMATDGKTIQATGNLGARITR